MDNALECVKTCHFLEQAIYSTAFQLQQPAQRSAVQVARQQAAVVAAAAAAMHVGASTIPRWKTAGSAPPPS